MENARSRTSRRSRSSKSSRRSKASVKRVNGSSESVKLKKKEKSRSKKRKKDEKDEPQSNLLLFPKKEITKEVTLKMTRSVVQGVPVSLDEFKSRKSFPRIFLNKKRKFKRLPENVSPKHYEINLFPHLDIFTFSGTLVIKILVNAAIEVIVLNSAGLRIESVSLYKPEEEPLEFVEESADETLLIQLKYPLSAGEYSLQISYNGSITEQLKGIYFARFTNDRLDHTFGYNYVAKCEPCDCRRIFPCFDEPQFKCTFALTMIVPRNRTVVSNTRQSKVGRGPTDYLRQISFETTKTMSTFMFGFVIGDFEQIESVTQHGVTIRVFTPPKKKRQGKFALNVACKVMDFMQEFLGQPFPLSKMNFIAVRQLNTVEVQSCWGLTVFRDDLILIRDDKTPREFTSMAYQKVALVIAQSVAFQWFADIVSTIWWSDIWLSIGLSTYFQYLSVDKCCKELEVMSQFPNKVMNEILKFDICVSTQPRQPVDLPDPPDIEEILSGDVESKGASVMRMLHSWVGDTAFKEGIANYLHTHTLNTALKTGDFWNTIGRASGQPVENVMKKWVDTRGFPVVIITGFSVQGKMAVITLKQERFVDEVGRGEREQDDNEWSIPLSIVDSTNPTAIPQKELMSHRTQSLKVRVDTATTWVLLNSGQTGYFRVQYPKDMMAKITVAISTRTLQSVDRGGILQGLHALAMSGYVSVIDVLQLLPSFMNDTDYNVWHAIDDVVEELDHRLMYATSKAYEKFQNYVIYIYSKIDLLYGRRAFEKKHPPTPQFTRFLQKYCKCFKPKADDSHEEHLKDLLFPLVIRRHILCGHGPTIAWAKNLFIQDANDEGDLYPDLIGPITMGFCAWRGSEEDLHLICRAYRKAKSMEAKELLVDGFAVFKVNALIRKILQFAITPHITLSHTVKIMLSVSTTKLGKHMVWYFFKEHLVHFQRQYYHNEQLLKPLFYQVFSNFMTKERQSAIANVFSEKQQVFQGLDNTIKETLESIQQKIAWAKRDLAKVNQYLVNLDYGSKMKGQDATDGNTNYWD